MVSKPTRGGDAIRSEMLQESSQEIVKRSGGKREEENGARMATKFERRPRSTPVASLSNSSSSSRSLEAAGNDKLSS